MSSAHNLLLIDGNNTSHRVFWANRKRNTGGGSFAALTHKGREVDVLYGFFRQLVHLDKQFPDHIKIVVWDRGHERRTRESEEGVRNGIVPSAYKATRAEMDENDKESLREQMDELQQRALPLVRCLQVAVGGVEADDIIFTYAKKYAALGWKSVIVSTDHDFFQALDDNTVIYNATKSEVWTRERFETEFGFPPGLWVDAGAIMGETGPSKDNIHGVDGWGPKTAFKYVAEFGGVDAIVAHLESKEKRGKKEQVFIDQLPRLRLALSLKRMDMIPDVPKLVCPVRSEEELTKYFLEWGFASLLKEASRLV